MADQSTALRIELHPSLLLLRYLLFVHLAALLVLACYSPSPAGTALGSTAVVWSLVRAWRRFGSWYGRHAIRALNLAPDDGWMIEFGDARQVRGVLLRSPLVAPRLVILSFRTGWTRRHALLLADNADPSAVRRLRVRLRFQARGGSPAAM